MSRLQGKVAVVTGGSRGIGKAIAVRLAKDGAAVVVNYAKSAGQAKEVVAAIEAAGGRAAAVGADIAKPEDVRRLFEETLKRFGRLDILVNNAGVYEMKALEEINEAHYERLFSTNVRGPLFAMQEAARRIGSGGGRIINISSVAARAALAGSAIYSATKAALESLTRCLATELGPRQITVNAVAPGTTDTEMFREGVPAEMQKAMIKSTPLGRLGTPKDIADLVAFLASDDGRWLTGQTIDTSGGLRV
jgi:3-oxoacyl-[acyl-carrier protein] reductase